jgi:DNA-binding NarL/FixJ family response regulator
VEVLPTPRCVVADDHPALLKAVADYLRSSGYDVVGEAADGREAVALALTEKPDFAILDMAMPTLPGIDAARELAEQSPSTAIILYTGEGEAADLLDALDIGVRGFVLKGAPLHDLLRAISTVLAGGTYVDAALGASLASRESMKRPNVLTPREQQILELLANGLEYRAIGERLNISSETVRSHVQSAVERLHADNRTQAVATAIRQSLIR